MVNSASPRYRILATRPAAQNGAWCSLLEQHGFAALSLPVLAIEPVQEPEQCQAIKNLILDFDQFEKVIFVSQNAVREALVWLDQYWPQLPLGIHYFAVGAKTAAALREQGVAATACHQAMNSEELLQLPQMQAVQGQKVLICRGIGGRPHMGEVLEARGARVHYGEFYHRRLPSAAAEQLRRADFLSGDWMEVLSAFSGESLDNLLDVLRQCGIDNAFLLPLLVPGERVAQQAQAQGFTEVITAANATDKAMLAALEQWRSAREAAQH